MRNRIDVGVLGVGCEDSISPYDSLTKADIDNRVMLINEQISDLVVDQQVMCILRWNAEDKDIPVEKRKTHHHFQVYYRD
jgi:hypothetical protein